jgi:hypothetical protein
MIGSVFPTQTQTVTYSMHIILLDLLTLVWKSCNMSLDDTSNEKDFIQYHESPTHLSPD